MNRFLIYICILLLLFSPFVAPSFARRSSGNSPTSLHQAIIDGDIDKVNSMLSGGMDVNARNNLGGTPLHTAIVHKNMQIIQLLLDKNADVNPTNNNGQTPLHIAVSSGQKEIVELLISKGADVNIVDSRSDNALSLAQKNRQAEIAEILVKHGATEPTTQMEGNELYGNRREMERPVPTPGGDNVVQRRPGPVPAQEEPEVDILADPNEIKARIKTFAGLEKSIEEAASQSRIVMRRWQQVRTDNRSTLVRVVQRQFDEELDFINKVALEEKAKKTAAEIEALQSKKKDRTSKILKELTAQSKEQRQTRSTGRTRGRTTGRGGRGTGTQTGRYTTQSQTYAEQPVRRRGSTPAGTNEDTAEPEEPVDPEEQSEIDDWLQADVQDYEGKITLFTASNERIQTDFIALRKLSEEEKANKTTAAIDGLLLARKLRYDELNQYIQEEKLKLEQEQEQTGQTTGDTTGQTGTRRRRR